MRQLFAKHYYDLAVIIFFIFIPCLLLSKIISGQGYIIGDVWTQYWADICYILNTIKDGELPLWNPFDRGGYPFFADPQAGLFYPLNWILWIIAMPFSSHFALKITELRQIIHISLMGINTYFLLRHYKISRPACVAAGLIYMFGPYTSMEGAMTTNFPVVYFPLVLLGIEKLFDKESGLKEVGFFSLASYLAIVSQNPTGTFYVVFGAFIFFIIRLAQNIRQPYLFDKLKLFALSSILLSLMVLIVLFPLFELISQSVRTEITAESVLKGSRTPNELINLFIPKDDRYSLYMGISTFIVFPAFLLLSTHIRLSAPFIVFIIFGIWLALGKNGELLPQLINIIPVFKFIRSAQRYIIIAQLGFAVLAGLGLDAVFKSEHRSKSYTYFILIGAVSIFLLYILFYAYPPKRNDLFKNFGYAFFIVAIISPMLLWMQIKQTFKKGLLFFIALVIASDVVLFCNVDKNVHAGISPVAFELPGDFNSVWNETHKNWRAWDEYWLRGRSGARFKLREFRSYRDPLMYKKINDIFNSIKQYPQLLPQYNVKYLFYAVHPERGFTHHLFPSKKLSDMHKILNNIFEFPSPVPFSYITNSIYLTSKNVLEKVGSLAPGYFAVINPDDINKKTLNDIYSIKKQNAAPYSEKGQLINYSRNHIKLKIKTEKTGVLVVNEVWNKWWSLSIDDDSDSELFPVNYILRGAVITPGEHIIEMNFWPAYLYIFIPFWLIGLIVSIYLALRPICWTDR